MKILFLTRLYYPHIGGVERHVEEVGKKLVEMGHEVVIVSESSTSEESIRPPPRCLDASIPSPRRSPFGSPSEVFSCFTIPVGKGKKFKKFQIWWWLFKNRSLINRSDIVHAHDVGFWYFPFRFLYPKKPFYVTFHGWEEKYPPPLKNKIIRKISEGLAIGNICVGDYISKWYGTKPDYVVYGGVNPPPRRSPSATSEVSLPLVFIGRLEKDTGLPIYLKALEILHTKYQILFLGEGRGGEEARKYGKVLGFVRDTRPYIWQSRFVFTSGYLSILEAMSCKRLVFAVYDNPLKEDYLKLAPFAQWMVIEKNPKKLAEKIKYYLAHPEEEEKLVSRGYNWLKEQTWDKVSDVYLELWGKKDENFVG